MGKKVILAAENTSKTIEKKKFNSLIKVLKPKVYITDSASFKRLVQELTGNGAISSNSNPSSPEIEIINSVQPITDKVVIPVVGEDIPIINIDDQDAILAEEKDNLLLDDALDCFYSWNQTSSGIDESRMPAVLEEITICVGEGKELDNWKMQENNQQLSDNCCSLNQTLSYFDGRNPRITAWEDQQQYDMEWLAFQEVESWLLDSDQQPFPPCGQMIQQQIHEHNYNLSTSWLQ